MGNTCPEDTYKLNIQEDFFESMKQGEDNLFFNEDNIEKSFSNSENIFKYTNSLRYQSIDNREQEVCHSNQLTVDTDKVNNLKNNNNNNNYYNNNNNSNNDLLIFTPQNKNKEEFISYRKSKRRYFVVYSFENITTINSTKTLRKERTDNIRKKIQGHFFRDLIQLLNQKLRKAGASILFIPLPQNFIINTTRKIKGQIIGKTWSEILRLSENYQGDGKKQNCINSCIDQYIKEHQNIKERANYDVISNLTFEQIYTDYLNSEEYEKNLKVVKTKESAYYFNSYYKLSQDLISYYSKQLKRK